MTRLPIPGKDPGTWGDILNDFLNQSHKTDGSLKNGVVGSAQLQDNAVTETTLSSAVQTKLNQTAPVTKVNNQTGDITLTKTDIGLNNVDNTADTAKPISTTQQAALDLKADTTALAAKLNTADLDTQTAAKITTNGTATQAALSSTIGRRSPLLGAKIRGGNITVKPSGGSWGGLFSEWDWDNWIRPQIDRAAALGLNAVRLIGSPGIVRFAASGGYPQITQSQYNERWLQVADYCNSLGLMLYPALCEKWAFWNGVVFDFDSAEGIATITSSAAALATRSNVIGFDVFQEGSGSTDGLTLAQLLNVYAAIRAVAPNVPLTTSSSVGGFGSVGTFWTDTASLAALAWAATDGADFVDLHVYLTDTVVDDLTAVTTRWGMPVVIGEFGAGQDLSTIERVRRFGALRHLHSHTAVTGSFVWALADQGVNDSEKYGVWDNTGFTQGSSPLSISVGQRTELVEALAQFGPAEVSDRPRNLLGAAASWPLNALGWSSGANTNHSSGALGLDVFPTTAAVFSCGTSATTQALVAPSTMYRFEVEMLSNVAGRALSVAVNWYDAGGAYLSSSTMVNGTSATVTPARFVGLVPSHPSAAYARLLVRGTATATGERHTILRTPQPILMLP